MVNTVKSGSIGSIKDVEATFTKLENPANRELTDVMYGGSFTELASYTLLPIVKILGTNYNAVRFESFKNEKGIDIYTKAYLNYENAIATSKNGLGVKSEGQLIISGTKGYCIVEAPWWKTKSFELRFEDAEANEKNFFKFLGDGLRYELSDFVAVINGYGNKAYRLTREESVVMAELMERFLAMNRK